MPEYRRFIAYFYEYTDGRKQGNSGFVKVELRDKVWRLLIRLNAGIRVEPPIQVYGFARESGYQLKLPLGTIRPVFELAGERAFYADTPEGKKEYRPENFAGIWIESGEGRCFGTVWDDEGIDPGRFATELPESAAAEEDTDAAESGPEGAEADAAESGSEGVEADVPEPLAGEAEIETETSGARPEAEPVPGNIEARAEAGQDAAGLASEDTGADAEAEPEAAESGPRDMEEIVEAGERPGWEDAPEIPEAEQAVWPETAGAEVGGLCGAEKTAWSETAGAEVSGQCEAEKKVPDHAWQKKLDVIGDLFRRRTHFQPFSDMEMENCVMILPCDLVRLQQDNWNAGRSSFLQHGFYQYRHLLLGMDRSGAYVLGVPGIRNSQETYMARMFGFDRFIRSEGRDCGREFGYWCRELRQCEPDSGGQ